MNARVAIVMATYNGERWVADQLASILSQTHAEWHLFVRDDGSADATLSAIRHLVAPDRLTVLDPNGASTGSPAGNFFSALCLIDLAAFDFVAFADQDDVWSPDKLQRAIERLRDTGAQGYSCDLVAFDNQTRRAWYVAKSQPQRALDYLFQGASAGCTYVITSTAARLVADKVRPYVHDFPRNRSHDWLIYAICRSHGLTWIADESAYIFYRQHAANAFGALPSAAGLLARWRLSRQRWYREHVRWLAGFLQMSAAECEVLDAVERLAVHDRLLLARRSAQFRRTPRDQLLLSVALLTGSF